MNSDLMDTTNKPSAKLLFLIILLEGFVVLSVEMLAIRMTIPFVGSGTDTISIIIAGVLLALAAGYHRGGAFSELGEETINSKLQKNFLISLIFISVGLGYGVITPLFEHVIEQLSFNNRLVLTLLYTLIFLVTPVYLLGQTIPLVLHHFKDAQLSATAGKVLFFSTLGSFLGAVVTTVIFMNWFGVPYTVCITLIALFSLIFLISKKGREIKILACLFLCIGIALNSPFVLRLYNLVHSNAYSFVQVYEHDGNQPLRYVKINGAFSSSIFVDESNESLPMRYADYIEKYFIQPIRQVGPEAKILILGAGGFTLGRRNHINPITYVDIDPDLKSVIEEDFLKSPIGKNKKFVAQPARSFLSDTEERFDLIILDIGKGITGSPEHLITQEFYNQVKAKMKPEGFVLAHYYIPAFMNDPYTRNLDATLKSVFPHISRVIMGGVTPWKNARRKNSVIYIYQDSAVEDGGIYTDTLNRAMFDKGSGL